MTESQTKTNLFAAKKVRVLCPQCHTRLCDRVKDAEMGWILKFRTGRWPCIMSNWFVLTCSHCNTTHRIRAKEGIVESLRPAYASTGIQAKTSDPANGSE